MISEMVNNSKIRKVVLLALTLACFVLLAIILVHQRKNTDPPNKNELGSFVVAIREKFPEGSAVNDIEEYFRNIGFSESSYLESTYESRDGKREVWILPTGRYNPPSQFNDGRYNQIYKICTWHSKVGIISDMTCYFGHDKIMF